MSQRIFVKGRVYDAEDDELQCVLARIYETPERPRCMCIEEGVDLYISRRLNRYYLARMPGTGRKHHPACPDYELDPGSSGRGALVGNALVESAPDQVEIHVDFALSKCTGRTIPRGESTTPKEVRTPKRRMSLRAVMHMLYEDARFNRWYPKMAGARSQGVLCRYLTDAADHVIVRGEPLSARLYVPEPFILERKDEISARRREKLAFLSATQDSGSRPFGFVIGQFKEVAEGYGSRKLILKHMPDLPLYLDEKSWERAQRLYDPLFKALDATEYKPRILIAALISAQMENVFQIERMTMMLVSEEYIPVSGAFELQLVRKLRDEGRTFIKPLQYDAASDAAFPNFILLDARNAAGEDYPLHVRRPFFAKHEQSAKDKAIAAAGDDAWVWDSAGPVPPLPPARRFAPSSAKSSTAVDRGTAVQRSPA